MNSARLSRLVILGFRWNEQAHETSLAWRGRLSLCIARPLRADWTVSRGSGPSFNWPALAVALQALAGTLPKYGNAGARYAEDVTGQ